MNGRENTPADSESTSLRGFDDYDLRLGDIMRGERATMGKSLLDVQRELKIKATYIAAIENTDPTVFETPGFVAGYVRSYARYLNLDPEWAYKTFCNEGNFVVAHGMSAEASGTKPRRGSKAATGPAKHGLRDPLKDPSVAFIPKGEAAFTGIEPRAVGSVAVLCALIGGIGYGGWAVLQEVQKVRFAPVESAPGVLSDLDPIAAPAVTQSTEVADAGGVNAPPSMEALDRLYRPEALDVPVMVARDGPISTLNPDAVGALRPNMPSAGQFAELQNMPDEMTPSLVPVPMTQVPVQVVEDAVPEVVLFAVRPSWVRVRAADGTVIFEKILDSGEEFLIPSTEEPSTLRAGNAGSVYFRVNGQTFGPAGDGASVVREVALGAQVLPDRYKLADISRDADLARIVAVAEARPVSDTADTSE
jgi:hypothetical protein